MRPCHGVMLPGRTAGESPGVAHGPSRARGPRGVAGPEGSHGPGTLRLIQRNLCRGLAPGGRVLGQSARAEIGAGARARPEQESNGDQAWNSSQETAQPVSMPRPTDLADASAVTVADVSQTAVTLTELQEEIRSWLLGIDCTLLSYFDIIEENYDTVDQICRLYLVEDGGQRRLDPLFFEDNQVTDAEHQRLFRQWFAGKGAHLPDPNPCQEPEAAGPAEAPALTGTAGLDSRGDDPWFAGKDPWAKPGVAPLNGGEGPKDGPRSPPLPKEEPLPGAGQDPSHPAVTNGAGNGSPAPVTTGPHVSSEAWRSWWSSPDGGWSSSWSSWDGSWR
ncbi:unnamed protein product [Effrenium voratum]|uniref:Uncharacterized protein n=1 Tax=Effrenium voratum TaxID=2562239 RepID=A0AA36IIJ9_9DINO|nr:unnamed protein product [Effrenium voratum]